MLQKGRELGNVISIVIMDVLENPNILKEGPLFAPVGYTAQFYPLLAYIMEEPHIGLGASIAENFNKSCVS